MLRLSICIYEIYRFGLSRVKFHGAFKQTQDIALNLVEFWTPTHLINGFASPVWGQGRGGSRHESAKHFLEHTGLGVP